jgi:hypothetical protein
VFPYDLYILGQIHTGGAIRCDIALHPLNVGSELSAGALLDGAGAGVYIPSYELGKLYLALGDVPSALMRLERAHTDRAHSMAFLKVDPQLRALSSEPRFQKLVQLVEKP